MKIDKRTKEYKDSLKQAYRAILKVNGEERVGEGDTVEQAVLNTKPEVFKTYGYLQIFKEDKKSFEIRLPIFKGKRLFDHDLFRMLTCRNLERSLG